MAAAPDQIDKKPDSEQGAARGVLARMFARSVVINAGQIALVVGTCLNAINQGNAIWHGAAPEWGKLVMNYIVPFLVASFSAARNSR